MNSCVTCGGRAQRLSVCLPCAERAESMLHAPVKWTPFQLAKIHPDLVREGFEDCWMNSRYTVLIRRVKSDMGDLFHLSVKRNDKNPLHDWRDLQRIKNELLGEEEEAMELYPAESRLVDGANQYHLWSFAGQRAPFGYDAKRCVMLPGGMDGAKQRPFEEPPKDAMTEEQFQEKLAEHQKRRIVQAAVAGTITSILEKAAANDCQNTFRYTDGRKCEAVKPENPEEWCGPCLTKIVRELQKELDSVT